MTIFKFIDKVLNINGCYYNRFFESILCLYKGKEFEIRYFRKFNGWEKIKYYEREKLFDFLYRLKGGKIKLFPLSQSCNDIWNYPDYILPNDELEIELLLAAL